MNYTKEQLGEAHTASYKNESGTRIKMGSRRMFNFLIGERDFCDWFEYKICEYLRSSNYSQIRGFWCDGVIYETALEDNIALFTVFTGKTGQSKYQLFLEFGEKSKNFISTGSELKLCFPEFERVSFYVDIHKKQFEFVFHKNSMDFVIISKSVFCFMGRAATAREFLPLF